MGLGYNDLTTAQKEFAYYLLTLTECGGIDSDIKWASTNYDLAQYGDPITVAPNSYTGTEFQLFGEYVRDNYPNFWADWPQTWKDDVTLHPASDSDYWWNRTITWSENETYKAAVMDNLADAKEAIVSFFFSDSPAGLKYWIDYMTQDLGVDTNDIKTLMYYFQICVLAPYVCSGTWTIVGDAPLTQIRDCAVAYMAANDRLWHLYGEGWTNRFTITAWDAIVEWDGVSAPVDYGVNEGVGSAGGLEPGNAVASVTGGGYDKAYLANGNQDLILVDAGGNKTLFRRANAGNVWISTKTSTVYHYEYSSNPNPDGDPGSWDPGSLTGGWPYAAQLLQDFRDEEMSWTYNQLKHSTDPFVTKEGDCSSLVWWGVNRYDPDTANKLLYWDGGPGNTTSMQQECSGVIDAGFNGVDIDTSDLLPGDLIFCNYKYQIQEMQGADSGSHVAMWFAPGIVVHILPQGGPMIVDESYITDAVLYWEVRRMPYGD